MSVFKTVLLKLKPGSNAEKVLGGEAVVKVAGLIKAAPGNLGVYYGPQIEDPSIFLFVVLWASLDDHLNYEQAPQYKEMFIPLLGTLVDLSGGPPLKFTAHLTTNPTVALTSPVTEFALFALPKDSNAATKAKFIEAIGPFLKSTVSVGGSTGNSVGLLTDDSGDSRVPDLGPGVFQAVIGYPSLEAHQAFQKTPEHDTGLKPVLQEFKASSVPLYGKPYFHATLKLAK